MNDPDDLPTQLRLDPTSDTTYRVPVDDERAATGYAVYGGQILAQMIMAATAMSDKIVQSVHAVFARAGTYAEPIHYDVDPMHDGRSFASSTVTCRQGDRLIARGIILLSSVDPDFLSFQREERPTTLPVGPGAPDSLSFPGSVTEIPFGADESGGLLVWTRRPEPCRSPVANQAMLSWGTDGYLIGAALGPHPEYDESDAHKEFSSGVVSHTISFHRPVDLSEWHLLAHEHIVAGGGRVFGRCSVFARTGELVASFSQVAMVRARSGQGTL